MKQSAEYPFYVESLVHHMQYEKPDGKFLYKGIVYACDSTAALEKLENHWNRESEATKVIYTVLESTVFETIM